MEYLTPPPLPPAPPQPPSPSPPGRWRPRIDRSIPGVFCRSSVLWLPSVGPQSITCKSVPLCSDLVVEGVELLSGGAVKVEPPVADEVVLVEEGSVGAEEAVLGEPTSAIGRADVESLALSLRVRVVT